MARMAARSIGSVTIALGSVAIPVKMFTAQAKREICFNRIDRKTGGRVKQQQISAADGRVLESADIISGYEYTPDQFVTFEPDELKALELAGDPSTVRIRAVAPLEQLDPMRVIRSVILGPDKGAARAYHLLASLLAHRGELAVGQLGGRTRDALVVLAPHPSGEGLVLHECLYTDEIRLETLREVGAPGVVLTSEELELGARVLDGIRHSQIAIALGMLSDGGADRVKAAVDRKVAGQQIVTPPPREAGAPLDLLEQLRASAPQRGPRKARPPAPPSQVHSRRARRSA